MTYKELERQIQNINIAYDMDFKVWNNGHSVSIKVDNLCYVIITNRVPYSLYIPDVAFENLEDNLRHDLLKAVYEFAQTPIDARNLFPRFYISSKLTPNDDGRFLFKNGCDIDNLIWNYKGGGGDEFTQEEIDYIKKKFNTDLSDFNIEEVKE